MNLHVEGTTSLHTRRFLRYLAETYPLQGRNVKVVFLPAGETIPLRAGVYATHPQLTKAYVGLFQTVKAKDGVTTLKLTIGGGLRNYHRVHVLAHEWAHALQFHTDDKRWTRKRALKTRGVLWKQLSQALEDDANAFAKNARRAARDAGVKHLDARDRRDGWIC